MNLQKGNNMKEIFKNYRVFDYELTSSEKENGVTSRSFKNAMEAILDDDFDGDYFLVNVTNIEEPTDNYSELYDTYLSYQPFKSHPANDFKAQMVGEFSDGQIEERNKEHYLIFRVEVK